MMYPFQGNGAMNPAAMNHQAAMKAAMMSFNMNTNNNNRTPSYGNNAHMMHGAPTNNSIIIRPNDVLCGRGKTSFNHSGNRRFRHIISQSIDEYRAATSKWEKSLVAARLVSVIHSSGGRFLKQKKDNEDEWYELSSSESKSKVSHAIRDAIAATKPSRRMSKDNGSSGSLNKPVCSSSNLMDDSSNNTAATAPMDDSSDGSSFVRPRYRGTWSSNSLVSLTEDSLEKPDCTTSTLRNEEWGSSSDDDEVDNEPDDFASYIHSVLGPAHP